MLLIIGSGHHSNLLEMKEQIMTIERDCIRRIVLRMRNGHLQKINNKTNKIQERRFIKIFSSILSDVNSYRLKSSPMSHEKKKCGCLKPAMSTTMRSSIIAI